MASPAVPMLLDQKQQDGVVRYMQNCVESLATVWNLRQQFLYKDMAYYRELDRSAEHTKALLANMAGDPSKFQNPVVPIVMPQVESALAYLGGVFLTGYPIFGVTAAPAQVDAALQMETIIAENSVYYGWTRQLIMFLRDCLKYNFGALEVSWKKKRIYSLVTDPAANLSRGTEKETYYEGNCLKRLDPYNMIWDKRVLNPAELPSEGEFVGWTEVMSRIALKKLLLDLPAEFTMNARKAFESGSPTISMNGADSWFYIPQINPASFLTGSQFLPTTNWMAWATDDMKKENAIKYNNMYEVTTLYGRLIPSDFSMRVPQRNQPQIWKFILINRKVLVYVERQTNAHNLLPVLIGQPNEDGMGYQSKSFLDNAVPFQYMSTAAWNTMIESKRRLVFDRIFYDPSRVRKEDIDRVGTVGRIPVKQSAYGKPVSDAVYAFPYRDDNASGMLQTAQALAEMADIANGQNRVDRGQFQKGNKTKVEFQTTMGNSNSRQQLQALGVEYQVMVPLKEMIKINILQYQPQTTLYNRSKKDAVEIKPNDLRAAQLAFMLSDGLLPTDKLLSTDLLQVFMQTIQTSPLMQAEFDMIGAFAYWCKMQGAHWFEDFRRNAADRDKIMGQLASIENAGKTDGARPQNAAAPAQGGPGQ